MSIEKYFRTLQRQIEGCPAIVNTIVTYEKRDHAHGFIRGELFFIDGSVLHLREFVQVWQMELIGRHMPTNTWLKTAS